MWFCLEFARAAIEIGSNFRSQSSEKTKQAEACSPMLRAMAQAAPACLGVVNFLQLLRNESVAIGHLNSWQRLGVDDVLFLDDFVAIEHKGNQGIYFVGTQRTFLV